MSYQLIIIDRDVMPEFEPLMEQLEQLSQPSEPSPKLAAFLSDVQSTFPNLEDDAANSPWSISPSGQASLDGRALGFAVAKLDLLFDVLMEFDELAWRHDAIICDPQEGSLRRPRAE